MTTKKKAMTNHSQFQARQGDVFVEAFKGELPADAKRVARDKGRVVLAYGEVTTHSHSISSPSATLWECADGARYLEAKRSCSLSHEEHDAIKIPIGLHIVTIQREHVPGELPRMVVD